MTSYYFRQKSQDILSQIFDVPNQTSRYKSKCIRMTYIIACVYAGVALIVGIVVYLGDGSSNSMTYIIARVYAGVAVIVIIVAFTGDGSSNSMTYIIACICAGVAVIVSSI